MSATSTMFGSDWVFGSRAGLSGVSPTSLVGSDAWGCIGFMGVGVCTMFIVSYPCNVESSSMLMDKLGI